MKTISGERLTPKQQIIASNVQDAICKFRALQDHATWEVEEYDLLRQRMMEALERFENAVPCIPENHQIYRDVAKLVDGSYAKIALARNTVHASVSERHDAGGMRTE